MSQTMNEDLNVIANSDLEITMLDGDLAIIQKLDDEPNDVGGLTSAQLKAKFDQAGLAIQSYLNNTLIPELLAADATEAAREAAEAGRQAAEAARAAAEAARAAAEQERVNTTSGIVAQATQAAQQAAASAEQAAQTVLGTIPDGSIAKEKLVQEVQRAVQRAASGGDIDASIQKKPNPNLLDNWYFGNPVDQRQGRIVKPNTTYYSDNTLATSAGTTSAYVTAYRYTTGTASGVSYASFKLEDTDTAPTYYAAPENVVRGYTGYGYGIDRWELGPSQTLLIRDNHIALSTNDGENWLIQKIEHHTKYVGSTLTASALITAESAGTMRFMFSDAETQGGWGDSGWSQVDFSDNETKLIIFTRKVERGMAGIIFQPITTGVWFDIYAAKPELGSQQTLAHQDENGVWVLNEIPDYGQELAKCQRYHINLHQSESLGLIFAGNNFGDIQTATFDIPTPVTMRAKPVITDVVSYGSLIFADGTKIAVSEILVDCVHASSARVFIRNTGRSVFGPVSLIDAKFSLYADL